MARAAVRARRRSPAASAPPVVLSLRHARRLSADALGGARRAAGVRHARRGRLPRRAQHHPAVEGRGLHGAGTRHRSRASLCSARSPAIRFPTRRRSSSPRWRARCRSGSRAPIAIEAPFAALHKADVIRRGVELGVPLELTLSCMQPKDGRHCGQLQQVPRAPRRVPGGRRRRSRRRTAGRPTPVTPPISTSRRSRTQPNRPI